MKKTLPLVLLFIITSLLCFYHPKMLFYSDWMLFVLVFVLTSALVFFQRQRRVKKGKTRFFSSKERFGYLDLTSEAIILFDSLGEVIAINAQAEKLFKITRADAVGSNLLSKELEVFWHHFNQLSKIAHRVITEKKSQLISFSLGNEGDEGVDLTAKVTAEKGVFALIAKESVSDQKLHKMGKDFVANASHELRTPITIIKGFAETIRDLPEISDGMLEDFIEKIVRNCHRMDSLVKNLLILTDLDNLPKARLQECDVVCLLDNCAHTLLSVHPDAEIEILHSEDYITVLADPDLLELAFMNLLENAAKYSLRVPKISITIAKSDLGVNVTISDQGKGIPQEDLDSIFERFYTVNKAHSRKLGGAGLGLSIVKTIIAKHDAEISVFSELGRGTTFNLAFSGAHCILT